MGGETGHGSGFGVVLRLPVPPPRTRFPGQVPLTGLSHHQERVALPPRTFVECNRLGVGSLGYALCEIPFEE